MTDQSFNYTPIDICKKMIDYLNLDETKSYCEPFSGSHNIYNLLPSNKEYYEIQEGKDFFKCDKKYDIIITNPPYKDYFTDKKNIMIEAMDKCFEVANEKVILLIGSRTFMGFTPIRLQRWNDMGWGISDICVINIPKWYGRYYIITFEKDCETMLQWL